MTDSVLLIGNGVNNLTNEKNWSELLKAMIKFCKVKLDIEINNNKPFPLLYEEIYLNSHQRTEHELKQWIADQVMHITANEIHQLIIEKNFNNILTTNYEYTLEQAITQKAHFDIRNEGLVKENKFSVFRHTTIKNTKVWHIHGECNKPESINLGYEHYAGQLQQMRNYVVSGTNYKNKNNQEALTKRLNKASFSLESWIDFFFTHDIHIIGLALDYVETDIWWLLTYRARLMKNRAKTAHQSVNNAKNNSIDNKITYYLPKRFAQASKYKIQLFKAMNIETVIIDKSDFEFYRAAFSCIKK
jgi:hypothetical protein